MTLAGTLSRLRLSHLLAGVVLLVAPVLGLSSCADGQQDARPMLAVSVEPLRYIVEQIAGQDYNVVALIPADTTAENYVPTADQLVKMSDCRLYLNMGVSSSETQRMARLKEALPRLTTASVLDSVALLPDASVPASNTGDLHVWMSPMNAAQIGRNVCRILSEDDTARAETFRENLAAFLLRTDSLDQYVRERLQGLQHRTFLIYHPALSYFARDYGLQQLAAEENATEPSGARIEQLAATCRAQEVQTAFFDRKKEETVIRKITGKQRIRTVSIHPIAYDWPAEIKKIADALDH